MRLNSEAIADLLNEARDNFSWMRIALFRGNILYSSFCWLTYFHLSGGYRNWDLIKDAVFLSRNWARYSLTYGIALLLKSKEFLNEQSRWQSYGVRSGINSGDYAVMSEILWYKYIDVYSELPEVLKQFSFINLEYFNNNVMHLNFEVYVSCLLPWIVYIHTASSSLMIPSRTLVSLMFPIALISFQRFFDSFFGCLLYMVAIYLWSEHSVSITLMRFDGLLKCVLSTLESIVYDCILIRGHLSFWILNSSRRFSSPNVVICFSDIYSPVYG